MSNRKDDKDLQEYLHGDSELSRRYQAGRLQEPPEHLDNTVLRAARSSIVKRKYHNWYLPVSVAAVMVVGMSLLFRVYEEQGSRTFIEPEMNGMMKNGTGRKINEKSIRTVPESLPAAPAAGSYHATDSVRGTLQEQEVTDLPPAGTRILMREPESREVQQPSGEVMAVPAERKESPAENTASIMKLQDQSFTTESMDQEKPAPDSASRAEAVVSPGMARQAEELPADSRDQAEPAEQAGLVSLPTTAEKWLDEISTQWQAGEKELAVAGLQQFLESYPDYPESELVKRLPEDFDLSGFMQPVQ